MKRRDLLKHTAVTVTTTVTGTVVADVAEQPASVSSAQHPHQRAVFQQLPYFDFTGGGDTYSRPAAPGATRAYVLALSDEEFLRRHWFR